MPQAEDLFDPDFDAQLQGLFQQAEKAIQPSSPEATQLDLPKMGVEAKETASSSPQSTEAGPSPSLPGYLKPLIQGIEAVLRGATENTALIKRLEATEQSRVDALDAQKALPKIVSDLRAVSETRSAVSQSMFSALHEELKSYKDGFLLQTVHRPIIRDLVTVHDDIAELHRQVSEMAGHAGGSDSGPLPILDRLRQFETNLANNLHFVIEVLARLDVTLMPLGTGKLDKMTQRALSIEAAESEEDDGLVVRSLKPGFLWKEAVFRPEEVVIKRWKGGPKNPPPSVDQSL